jgi:hypothetical protein
LSTSEVTEVLRRDHEYSEQDARAVAVDAEGSVGRALQAESIDLVEAREGAQRLLDYTARAGDPSRRLDAARDVTAKKSTSVGERDQLAACLRALGSLLRDVSILSAGGDRDLIGNSDLEPQLASLAKSFDGQALGTRLRSRGRSTRGARAQRESEDRGRLVGSSTLDETENSDHCW